MPDITRQEEFALPPPDAPGRFASLEKALRRFEGTRAIILNLRDGFSDMREILGYENCLISMMIEEGHFADLLDRVVDFNLELARIARQRYGMPVVAMTDDIANESGLLLSPEVYFRLIAPRFRRVVQGYKSLGYLTIKHSDGDITPVIDWWIDSGVDCIDPVDPAAGLDLGDFQGTVRKPRLSQGQRELHRPSCQRPRGRNNPRSAGVHPERRAGRRLHPLLKQHNSFRCSAHELQGDVEHSPKIRLVPLS